MVMQRDEISEKKKKEGEKRKKKHLTATTTTIVCYVDGHCIGGVDVLCACIYIL
jgi:hypothetical protein